MRWLALVAKASLAMLLVLAIGDVAVALFFPRESRLGENFSARYLDRLLRGGDLDGKIVFLGDSVLWGYHLDPDQAVTARLASAGIPVANLSYEGGSTANTYAILRLMQAYGVRPRAVFFNVNLKEFNSADSAYRTLYPAVEHLAWPDLSPSDRALLVSTQKTTMDAWFDRALSRIWLLYGMRADVREAIWHDSDAASALAARLNALSGETGRESRLHVPTPDKFLGTYDLSPLDGSNVEVRFLKESVALLAAERIPAYAMLTPANHALLHDYIDSPDYERQLAYVTAILQAGGVRVLNYDRAFEASDFLDNDHLTAEATKKLAARIETAIGR